MAKGRTKSGKSRMTGSKAKKPGGIARVKPSRSGGARTIRSSY